MAEGCRGRALGGNSGRDSEERTFLAGPHAFASTTSRQRRRNSLAQRVSAGNGSLDGKPRRGDIRSNRRSLLTLGWVGHADDCIYSDGGRFPAVPRAAPPGLLPAGRELFIPFA